MWSKIGCILVFVAGLLSCENDSEQYYGNLILNDTLEISYQETLYNIQHEISLKLDSVPYDSRCPVDLVCIWSGMTEIHFTFQENNSKENLSLFYQGGQHYKKDTTIFTYKIELLGIEPKKYSEVDIKQADYKAKLIIIAEK